MENLTPDWVAALARADESHNLRRERHEPSDALVQARIRDRRTLLPPEPIRPIQVKSWGPTPQERAAESNRRRDALLDEVARDALARLHPPAPPPAPSVPKGRMPTQHEIKVAARKARAVKRAQAKADTADADEIAKLKAQIREEALAEQALLTRTINGK